MTPYTIARPHSSDAAQLDLNEFDFPLHPAVTRALAGCVATEASLTRYAMPHDQLTQELLAALARRHGVCGENIVLTAGSDAALEYLVHAFGHMTPHVPSPTYQYYKQLAEDPPPAVGPPPPGSLVYLVNPNNPTGAQVEEDTQDPSCVYIVDHAYAEFARDDHTLAIKPNVVYTRTFSKAFGLAGLRIGYIVGPTGLLDRVRARYNEKQVTVLAKIAARETLRHMDYYEGIVADIRTARREFQEFLGARGISYIPSHANFVAVHVGPQAERFVRALEGEGVHIRLRRDMEGYVRVTVGCASSMARVRAAFEKHAGLVRTAVICAIAKDEDLYIDEWVRYHLALGFSKIYIYDNSDEHALHTLPGRYPPGAVDVMHFPGEVRQMPAYTHFLQRNTGHTWCAFIDIDEFIVLKKHPDMCSFLEEHCPDGAVALNWYMFGSSGHAEYSPEPVLQRFQRRGAEMDEHVKSIVRLADMRGIVNPHFASLDEGKTQRTTDGMPFQGPEVDRGSIEEDTAVIHHYFTKSRQEYEKKMARGRADVTVGRSPEDFDTYDNNEVLDTSAWDFAKSAKIC